MRKFHKRPGGSLHQIPIKQPFISEQASKRQEGKTRNYLNQQKDVDICYACLLWSPKWPHILPMDLHRRNLLSPQLTSNEIPSRAHVYPHRPRLERFNQHTRSQGIFSTHIYVTVLYRLINIGAY